MADEPNLAAGSGQPSPTTAEPRRRWRWGLWLGAAGFLGLGNGVWNTFTGPVLGRIQRGLLNLITLGIESTKNDFYAHAARGSHDHFSDAVIPGMFVLVHVGFLVVAIYLGRAWLRQLRVHFSLGPGWHSAGVDRVISYVFGDPRVSPSTVYRRFRLLVFVLIGIQAYALGNAASATIKGAFCREANIYYARLRTLAAPHLTPQQVLDVDARFAEIQSRSDYFEIVKALDEVARRHSASVPPFSVW